MILPVMSLVGEEGQGVYLLGSGRDIDWLFGGIRRGPGGCTDALTVGRINIR
jgi:hypothetical protein